jgi:hypothetical protein
VRRFFTPGWLGLHAIAIVLIGLFLLAGYWQVLRGESGNLQSWAYAFEWPLFAVFVVVMWVRMVRDELRGEDPDEDDTEVPARAAPVVEYVPEEGDEELTAYNRRLARLHDEASQLQGR